MEIIKNILQKQKDFFISKQTLGYDFRIAQLKKLKNIVKTNEDKILAALKKDLNKPAIETILGEITLVIEEINFTIKHLKKWMRSKKVSTPLPLWPGKSYLYDEPYGTVLILGPWNFPFLLIISPLIGAISAGNCAIVKPSEHASATQNLICDLINENFSNDYIYAVKANGEETAELLKEKYDYIFFTGGTEIGRHVMLAAAKHLTPVTLELGGKSPCIIDKTADLAYTARRVILSKMMNAGQICIAPDYLLVHADIKKSFIEMLTKTLQDFYTTHPQDSNSYGRIINKKHFQRLSEIIKNKKVIIGGEVNELDLYIAPTILDNVDWDDDVMREEIFGPILPVITFTEIDVALQKIRERDKPLALYYFGKSQANEQKCLQELSYGGGCINDCVTQILNVNLPFGGVGPSGIGNYHGEYSFKTFSHTKSIFKKIMTTDLGYPYPPYTENKLKWVKKVLGWWQR